MLSNTDPPSALENIGSGDARYLAVVERQFNKRFRATPEYVRLAASTDEVIAAVDDAVKEGRRLVVTSGGHCLEGFVSDPDVQVIIDVSPMKRIYYDAGHRAVAIEAGATVVATRERSDPNRELWWAHTGGGGGNFGIVTRYWFRSPDAAGDDPSTLLPRAPESISSFTAEWSWNDIDERAFRRLLQNHGEWCEQNAGAESPNASLWTLLEIHRKAFGKIVVRAVSTSGVPAEQQARDHLAALSGTDIVPPGLETRRMSWLEFALNPLPEMFAMPPGGVSVKVKDAMLKKRLDDRQIGIAYEYLTQTDFDVMGGVLGMATYGGRVNAVAPDATASVQRSTILDMACNTGWIDPQEAEKNLTWVRAFYRDLFAETGGSRCRARHTMERSSITPTRTSQTLLSIPRASLGTHCITKTIIRVCNEPKHAGIDETFFLTRSPSGLIPGDCVVARLSRTVVATRRAAC